MDNVKRAEKAPSELELAIAEFEKGNYQDATAQLTRLADEGDAEAMYYLGVCFGNVSNPLQDFTTSKEWYLKSAAAGSIKGICRVAYMNHHGVGMVTNHKKAVKEAMRQKSYGNIENKAKWQKPFLISRYFKRRD